jgi:hypothetical protein
MPAALSSALSGPGPNHPGLATHIGSCWKVEPIIIGSCYLAWPKLLGLVAKGLNIEAGLN